MDKDIIAFLDLIGLVDERERCKVSSSIYTILRNHENAYQLSLG